MCVRERWTHVNVNRDIWVNYCGEESCRVIFEWVGRVQVAKWRYLFIYSMWKQKSFLNSLQSYENEKFAILTNYENLYKMDKKIKYAVLIKNKRFKKYSDMTLIC